MLRPYQQAVHDAAIAQLRKSTMPCLIEAATGAGKSHIISAIADTIIRGRAGNKVLVLQPTAELLEQNFRKFPSAASMFSASVGERSTRHAVVFGTPMTVKNSLERFRKGYVAVVLDECHGVTPTVQAIIEEMRQGSPGLRVVGMTATPYRLGSGYIYRRDLVRGIQHDEDKARFPYFDALVARVSAHELIEQGFLTPPTVGAIGDVEYDTSGLVMASTGHFTAESVDRAFVGQGRKTSRIVAEVVEKSRNRQGVMFFASTIRHAKEVLESLPPQLSAIVTGDTPAKERRDIIDRFKARRLKYLVNVDVLTTGFDAPHVDVIALLRATESVGLLQQMIGRGLRLSDGKADCLVLDYAQNVRNHCPDGDVFNPQIVAHRKVDSTGEMEVDCPLCSTTNTFRARPNPSGYRVDGDGYFVDLDGTRIENEFGGHFPAHFGRRCLGLRVDLPEMPRCEHRWESKECEECGHHNDIAARHCEACKAEIVNPNDKLVMNPAPKEPPVNEWQTEPVLDWRVREGLSKSGKRRIDVHIQTHRRTLLVFLSPDARHPAAVQQFAKWQRQTAHGKIAPSMVTYRKQGDFWEVGDYALS